MKIAFLSFYSGHIDRGVETAVTALSKHLGTKHQITIFQAGDRVSTHNTIVIPIEKNWPTDTSSSPLRFFYFDYYSRKILTFTLKFIPYFFKEKYDLVIPTNGSWQVVLIRFFTWLLGKKMIVQGNAGIGRDDFWQLLWFPNRFIAISPAGYKWARKKVPWVQTQYIPYGVDLKSFSAAQSVSVPLKKPIVLCVAAFLPYKRIELLIRAMAKVPNASLLVIGQGPLEQLLRNLGRQLLGNRFELQTGVTHAKLAAYYKAAQVFSLPSAESEAFGIVYVEAMAAGLPIVAPNDYNRGEIIGNAGILINPENTNEYAKALERALTINFEKKPVIQAANFSWDKIAEKYEQMLVELKN